MHTIILKFNLQIFVYITYRNHTKLILLIYITGIILACAMAHTFHIRRTENWYVRRNGTRFSRITYGNLTCAPFFLELVYC